MQRVVWNAALAHVGDHLITRPVKQRVHFDELMTGLDRSGADTRAIAGLVCTQPGNPPCSASESAFERLDLANRAAGMSCVNRGPKAVYTLATDERLKFLMIRVMGAYASVIMSLGFGPEFVGLGEEPAGIQSDNFDFQILSKDRV